MTSCVVYQPCSDSIAQKNLQSTILNPVYLSDINHFLEPDLAQHLLSENPSGRLFIWGVSPSPATNGAWRAMAPDDVVVFNCGGMITAASRFIRRTHNRELALYLWGLKDQEKGSTWENVYFVRDVKHVAIPYPDIRKCTVMQPQMSFYRFSESDSREIFANYEELRYDIADEPVTIEEARDEIIHEMQTDGTASTRTRKEHRYIVIHLFGNASAGICCICKNQYPRNMLVAAHIKKRAACDRNEKLDIENIAAPMCRMGCDSLFEYGYISVKEGKVIKHPSQEFSPSVAAYVSALVGNDVSVWSKKTKRYFDWHRNTHGFEPKGLLDN